jgi:hypothetical protein
MMSVLEREPLKLCKLLALSEVTSLAALSQECFQHTAHSRAMHLARCYLATLCSWLSVLHNQPLTAHCGFAGYCLWDYNDNGMHCLARSFVNMLTVLAGCIHAVQPDSVSVGR